MPIDLTNRRFLQCDMSRWTFQDVFLGGSVWTHVALTGARLVYIDFTGARFERCSFRNAELIYSASPAMTINGTRLGRVIPAPKRPRLLAAPEHDARLRELLDAERQRADGRGITIIHEPGRRYVGCNLRRAIFHEVGLDAAFFQNVCLAHATLTECNLNGALIDLSNLRDVQIIDSDIQGMTINGIPLTEVMSL